MPVPVKTNSVLTLTLGDTLESPLITPTSDTGVSGGNVLPRRYQIYGDLISSKQATEPLAVLSGVGPIIGFNVVTIGENQIIITGSNGTLSDLERDRQLMVRGTTKNSEIATEANISGKVVNSHVTPDGVLHVDPAQLTFSVSDLVADDVPTMEPRYLVVLANHTYQGANETAASPPSQTDFRIVELTDFNDRDNQPYTVKTLQEISYQELISEMQAAGLGMNTNTECLIGLYLLGRPETIADLELAFYQNMGFIIPLIPYEGKWPVVRNVSLREYLTQITSNQVANNQILSQHIGSGEVNSKHYADASIGEEKLNFDIPSLLPVPEGYKIGQFEVDVVAGTNLSTFRLKELDAPDGEYLLTISATATVTSISLSPGTNYASRVAFNIPSAWQLRLKPFSVVNADYINDTGDNYYKTGLTCVYLAGYEYVIRMSDINNIYLSGAVYQQTVAGLLLYKDE